MDAPPRNVVSAPIAAGTDDAARRYVVPRTVAGTRPSVAGAILEGMNHYQGPIDPDQLLASAAKFLIDGGEEDAASVLLACSLSVWTSGDSWYVGDETHYAVHLEVTGPRAAYDALTSGGPVGQAIYKALDATLPTGFYIKHRDIKAALVEMDADWRSELLE